MLLHLAKGYHRPSSMVVRRREAAAVNFAAGSLFAAWMAGSKPTRGWRRNFTALCRVMTSRDGCLKAAGAKEQFHQYVQRLVARWPQWTHGHFREKVPSCRAWAVTQRPAAPSLL